MPHVGNAYRRIDETILSNNFVYASQESLFALDRIDKTVPDTIFDLLRAVCAATRPKDELTIGTPI